MQPVPMLGNTLLIDCPAPSRAGRHKNCENLVSRASSSSSSIVSPGAAFLLVHHPGNNRLLGAYPCLVAINLQYIFHCLLLCSSMDNCQEMLYEGMSLAFSQVNPFCLMVFKIENWFDT